MGDPVARVRLRPFLVAFAVACFALFLAGPLAIAAAVLALAPAEVGAPVALGAVVFVLVLGYAMSSSFQWVELDGRVIRGKRLLTRRVVEYRVSDIVGAEPLH